MRKDEIQKAIRDLRWVIKDFPVMHDIVFQSFSGANTFVIFPQYNEIGVLRDGFFYEWTSLSNVRSRIAFSCLLEKLI